MKQFLSRDAYETHSARYNAAAWRLSVCLSVVTRVSVTARLSFAGTVYR